MDLRDIANLNVNGGGVQIEVRLEGFALFDGHPSPTKDYVDGALSNMFRNGEEPKKRFNIDLKWCADPVLSSVWKLWRSDDSDILAVEAVTPHSWNLDMFVVLLSGSVVGLAFSLILVLFIRPSMPCWVGGGDDGSGNDDAAS